MRRVILLRHGQSEINAIQERQPVFCGQLETPLTELGRRQAREAGKLLADPWRFQISHAVSSALGRATETLDLILPAFSSPPQKLPASTAFNERSLGIFEGHTEEDVFRRFPQYRDDPRFRSFRADLIQKAPDGENLQDVRHRAATSLHALLPIITSDLLLVAHCQTIRCLISAMTGRELLQTLNLQIPNAQPMILTETSVATWELTSNMAPT